MSKITKNVKSNNGAPVKKVQQDSEDELSDAPVQKKVTAPVQAKKPIRKPSADSSTPVAKPKAKVVVEESDSDEEPVKVVAKPQAKNQPTKQISKPVAKQVVQQDSEEESDDVPPPKKAVVPVKAAVKPVVAAKPAAKVVAKKQETSEEESEEVPAPKKVAPVKVATKVPVKAVKAPVESEEESDDVPPPKKAVAPVKAAVKPVVAAKPAAKVVAKKQETSEEESDDVPPPKKAVVPVKPAAKVDAEVHSEVDLSVEEEALSVEVEEDLSEAEEAEEEIWQTMILQPKREPSWDSKDPKSVCDTVYYTLNRQMKLLLYKLDMIVIFTAPEPISEQQLDEIRKNLKHNYCEDNSSIKGIYIRRYPRYSLRYQRLDFLNAQDINLAFRESFKNYARYQQRQSGYSSQYSHLEETHRLYNQVIQCEPRAKIFARVHLFELLNCDFEENYQCSIFSILITKAKVDESKIILMSDFIKRRRLYLLKEMNDRNSQIACTIKKNFCKRRRSKSPIYTRPKTMSSYYPAEIRINQNTDIFNIRKTSVEKKTPKNASLRMLTYFDSTYESRKPIQPRQIYQIKNILFQDERNDTSMSKSPMSKLRPASKMLLRTKFQTSVRTSSALKIVNNNYFEVSGFEVSK